MSFQPLRAATKKQHGISCCGKAAKRHGVDVIFCGFGAVRPDYIVSLDGWGCIRIGYDDDAGLLNKVFGNLTVPDCTCSHTGIHALKTFRTGSALKTSGRFTADLRLV